MKKYKLKTDLIIACTMWQEHPERLREGTIFKGQQNKLSHFLIDLFFPNGSIVPISKRYLKIVK